MGNLPRRDFLKSAGLVVASSSGFVTARSPSWAAEVSKPRRYQLGLVTYNLAKDWDLPTVLQVCQRVGLAAVELRTTHRHGVEPDLSAEARRDVKRRLADSGVVFWGCGSVCEFHAPDTRKVRDNIDTCIRFARLVADLGGRGVKVRPNDLPAGIPPERTIEQIGKALRECGRHAADLGIEIWVEVHGRGTALPHNMKAIMEQCSHPQVGITWNSNSTDLIRGAITESFAMLRPWLRSVHINDLTNEHRGTYPYRELFRLLREADYDRFTLIEVGKTFPDVGSTEEFLRYYKALWHELSHPPARASR
jgi:sugar phosphate isomerase/epimerase